jgi:hypothetical protein
LSLEDKYIKYAETLSELTTMEAQIHNKKRIVEELRKDLVDQEKGDDSFGIEFTAHAFRQVSERLEFLAMENPVIYNDVFKKEMPSDSLLLPSNLKSFVITLLADARKKNNFTEEESKNSNGIEYRYTINMNKWSDDKLLQFVAIVENNHIKTGFFNWVQK